MYGCASVGLQNITGLACDPVGNRVEWPCLGKNIMGGSNALASANMILAGYDKVIPLDETIGAIYEIGLSLPLGNCVVPLVVLERQRLPGRF